MKIVTDLHVHSHYSRATSKALTLENLDYWARIKGITVVGTGDCTHPQWLKEINTKLEPAEEGLFQLREKYKQSQRELPHSLQKTSVRFMLTGEISTIYKKRNKVRKSHSVIGLPSTTDAQNLQKTLAQIGNITSDGRPILRLDTKELLKISLEINGAALFFPAHIWTPWFSILGARSGFDSIEECFEELTSYIQAVEMGLSSNPIMNRSCSILDGITLLANSDAHSPEKLGRNVTLFDADLSYHSLHDAICSGDNRLHGTVSLFPQEGKYHYDGHRNCTVCLSPEETKKQKGICPVCGKPVTIGVTNRVTALADRAPSSTQLEKAAYAIIPLKQLLSDIYNVGSNSKRIAHEYERCITAYGSELEILLNAPLELFSTEEPLQQALHKMRSGKVSITEGYDGKSGKVSIA